MKKKQIIISAIAAVIIIAALYFYLKPKKHEDTLPGSVGDSTPKAVKVKTGAGKIKILKKSNLSGGAPRAAIEPDAFPLKAGSQGLNVARLKAAMSEALNIQGVDHDSDLFGADTDKKLSSWYQLKGVKYSGLIPESLLVAWEKIAQEKNH